jgi:hypothetical protein
MALIVTTPAGAVDFHVKIHGLPSRPVGHKDGLPGTEVGRMPNGLFDIGRDAGDGRLRNLEYLQVWLGPLSHPHTFKSISSPTAHTELRPRP